MWRNGDGALYFYVERERKMVLKGVAGLMKLPPDPFVYSTDPRTFAMYIRVRRATRSSKLIIDDQGRALIEVGSDRRVPEHTSETLGLGNIAAHAK